MTRTYSVAVFLSFAAASPSLAAVYKPDSTASLIEALASAGKNDVVELAAGTYELPEEPCSTNQLGGTGCSHLYVNTHLKGMGANRADTVLAGRGTFRILAVSASGVVENLTITNGAAKAYESWQNSKRGGGVYGTGVLSNCVVVGCVAENYAGGVGGGMTVRSCLVTGNHAEAGGGMHSGAAYGSEFVGNWTTAGSGGGLFSVEAHDCAISNNTSAVGGGGCYVMTYATNCVIAFNKSSTYGGGVYNLSAGADTLVACQVFGNMAETSNGGGIYRATMHGGTLHDNYAGGHGGGAFEGSCKGVRISNNICGGTGGNAYTVNLADCEISGTGIAWGSATRCEFHHIGSDVSLSGNPHKEATTASTYVYGYCPAATNCLFRDNAVASATGSLLLGVKTATRRSSLVNCTIVSNVYATTFSTFTLEAYPLEFVNCVFFGNKTSVGVDRDINFTTSTAKASFSHCAYGTNPKTVDVASFSDGTLYKFGENGFGESPRFQGGDHDPYLPGASSPLRDIGLYADWMADATDIRGNVRLKRSYGGKVDIGCYQFKEAQGMALFFR